MASNEKNVISSMLFQHVMMKSQRLKNQDIYLYIYSSTCSQVVQNNAQQTYEESG